MLFDNNLRMKKKGNGLTVKGLLTERANNAILTSSARTAIPCNVNESELQEYAFAVSVFLTSPSNSMIDKAVVEVLYLNGCRISELLSIKHSQIKSNGFISISGLKKSNSRILITNEFRLFWLAKKKSFGDIFENRSRFYFYRLFKKQGLFIKPLNSERYAVCHSFRHNLLRSITDSETTVNQSGSFVGQKRINSTLHYVEKKK
jgi:integrase